MSCSRVRASLHALDTIRRHDFPWREHVVWTSAALVIVGRHVRQRSAGEYDVDGGEGRGGEEERRRPEARRGGGRKAGGSGLLVCLEERLPNRPSSQKKLFFGRLGRDI